MKSLEQHFDTAFSATDGINKLRELIFTLAMQGKLVSQDPSEQSAGNLIKEVEQNKLQLLKDKKIKTRSVLPEMKEEELPYTLPDSWEWVRLGNIGEINPRNTIADNLDAGFVPMPLVYSEYGSPHQYERRMWSEIKKGYTHFANEDVGLAKITPCFENGKSCVFQDLPNGIGAGTTELHVFRNTFRAICPEYLLAYLKNPKYIAAGIPKMTGSAGQKRVPKDFFSQNPFPLPPLAEQRRIVAKIDQLMARCDELEKLRSEREKKLLAVHTSVLKQLLDAQVQDKLPGAWQFISRHFGELYLVKENVTGLRKAILQLAVMGKLVLQDPNDTPASELLNKISAEKSRLVKEGKIREPKPLPEIMLEEMPYALPEGWEWVRLGKVFNTTSGNTFNAELEKTHGSFPYVKVGDMNLPGNERVITTSSRFIDPDEKMSRGIIPTGSIIFPKRGGAIATNKKRFVDDPIFVDLNIMAISPMPGVTTDYAYIWLLTIDLAVLNTGTSVPQINHKDIDPLAFPLPPLSEQHLIVAQVNHLMELCDTLDQKINDSTGKKDELLSALMAQV